MSPARAPKAGAADEATLAALQDQLRYIEHAAPLGLWRWDAVSETVQWSEGIYALYGVAPGRFAGGFAEFESRLHPDDLERFRRERQAAVARGAPFGIDFRIVRPDGSLRWLSARATPEFDADGRLLGVHGMDIDVTALHLKDQALRLRDATIANMAEGVVLCSARTGRIVYANPRYEQMLGFEPGELLGQPAGIVNSPVDAAPEETVRAIVAELQRRGEWRGMLRNRRKDGRDIWIRASICSFDHPEHGPVWLNAIGDVTEEREAQLARDRALRELNRLTAGMQQTIEAERAALSRDVHDQLGAALTGMRMRLSALRARCAADPALQAELAAIAEMAQAASVQTRDICSRLRPPALDDLGLLETCRWYLGEWAAGCGLRVTRQLRHLNPEPAPALAIDVYRTLQELLTNVARHAAAAQVKVSLSTHGGTLWLRVADDGRGFPSRSGEHGLGLVGVRERAQRHGGQVLIEPGPSGTRVSVSFPCRAAPCPGSA